ncbi:hypothetical protein ACLOJK_016877 [Asimina triloba]
MTKDDIVELTYIAQRLEAKFPCELVISDVRDKRGHAYLNRKARDLAGLRTEAKDAPLEIEMTTGRIWSCSCGVEKGATRKVDAGGVIGGTSIDVDSNYMRAS